MTPLISVHHLGIRFGGIKALEDVSFDVNQGSITALIGPNGAGKTTIFNCITGFYRPSQGDVLLHTTHPPKRISRLLNLPFVGGTHQVALAGIARTFQNIRLFKDMTVLENVLVAQHQQVSGKLLSAICRTPAYLRQQASLIDQAYRWLETVGLLEFKDRLASELPYGHQRRLEIARAMSTSPRIICLDEPAAGLNPKETQELTTLIKTLQHDHQMTILLIEHDMGLVMRLSEHIIVLNYGSVIAQGPPWEIQNNPLVIEAYLGKSKTGESQ